MITRISLLFAAALLVATMAVMTAVPLFASPGEDACLAQNDADTTATWGKNPEGGGWTCTVTEDVNPGNPQSDNANEPFTNRDTETTSGQGGGGGQNTNPHHEEDSSTVNGGGNTPGGRNN